MYDKMSAIQNLICDAQKLATKLSDHDSSMDNILSQTHGVVKQVESMKEYCEEMNDLNEAVNSRPRIALIHSIQKENRHVCELQKENKELRMALEEHQNIMELIMSKYRQQIAKLISTNGIESSVSSDEDNSKVASLVERVSEMASVMRTATLLNEKEFGEYQRVITALSTENKGLREMIQIAYNFGSLSPAGVSDVHTQTDENNLQSTNSNLVRNKLTHVHMDTNDVSEVAAVHSTHSGLMDLPSNDSSESNEDCHSECGFNDLNSPNKKNYDIVNSINDTECS